MNESLINVIKIDDEMRNLLKSELIDPEKRKKAEKLMYAKETLGEKLFKKIEEKNIDGTESSELQDLKKLDTEFQKVIGDIIKDL